MAAEAEAQAIMKVQQALVDSLKLLNEAAPNDQVVKLKALETMEKVADGKEETLDYFQTIFRTRVDNGIYCVAYEAHSEEKWKGHDKGERFVFVRCSDGTTMSVFLGRFNDRKLLSAEVFSGNPKASFTRYDVR